ncbi:MAG: hypothetical protein ACLFT0_20455 [Spirulinaceae cyanobacterium]
MSESVAKQQRTTPGSSSSPIQPWSVEREADRLMDDLFSDLDSLLDGANQLPTEPAQPDYVCLKPVAIPSLDLTPSPVTEETITESAPPPNPSPAPKTSPAPKKRGIGRYLDKILFGVAFTSFLAVLGWLIVEGKIDIQRFLPQSAPSSSLPQDAVATSGEIDPEFVNYMLRSLELIENQPQTGQALPAAPGTVDPVTGNPTAPQVQWVPYPVYIPYNPGENSTASSLLPPPPATNSNPTPQAQASPQTETPATPQPQASPSPANPPQTPEPSPAVAPLPSKLHTLVGVIELGDGSTAALFKIDNTTQRIGEGEPIGDSGWTLVSAANQNAVVRRNGEVRSVYVGQEF